MVCLEDNGLENEDWENLLWEQLAQKKAQSVKQGANIIADCIKSSW